MIKRVFRTVFSALLVAGLLIAAMPLRPAVVSAIDREPNAPIMWRLATDLRSDTLQTNLLQEFADKVFTKSNGKLEIKIFTNGVLYRSTGIFDAVSNGALDLGFTSATNYTGRTPRTSSILTYTSSVANNLTDLNKLNNGMAIQSPILIADANNNRINHLFFGPSGSIDAFFKFPVNSLDDLKGKRLGCTEFSAPMVELMGAIPVPMDLADFYLSVQTGLVDGWVLCPLESYVNMKLYEVAPYLVSLGFHDSMSVLMNQATFDRLPPNIQTIVTTAAQETQADWNSRVEASDASYIDTLLANPNVHVNILSTADRESWMAAFIRPVFAGMMSRYMTAEEISQTKTLIAEIQADNTVPDSEVKGEAGGCCNGSAKAAASSKELAIGWGAVGLCWGGGYWLVRNRRRRK